MTEKLNQTIQEEVMKLPKEAQEAIKAIDWVHISEEIGKKYLLTEDEINDFQVETLLALVGLQDVNYFARNIENEVGSTEEAEKIAEEVFQKIFMPVNNMIVENIKKSGKMENPNFEQSVNFILSGGDYSAFIKQRESLTMENPKTSKIPIKSISTINTPTLADIQNNIQKTNPPAQTPSDTDNKIKFNI